MVATETCFYVYPEPWGNDPIYEYSSDGLKPPTRYESYMFEHIVKVTNIYCLVDLQCIHLKPSHSVVTRHLRIQVQDLHLLYALYTSTSFNSNCICINIKVFIYIHHHECIYCMLYIIYLYTHHRHLPGLHTFFVFEKPADKAFSPAATPQVVALVMNGAARKDMSPRREPRPWAWGRG